VQAFQVGARISCFSKILLAMSNERNTADLGECFVSLTFTVAVFWREILTVDVKVKKDYFEKLHVLYEVGLLLPSSSLSDVFAVGFLSLCCLLEPRPFQFMRAHWCGRRDSNPGSQAWKASTLMNVIALCPNQTRRRPHITVSYSHLLN
jgi:hypothetical protein